MNQDCSGSNTTIDNTPATSWYCDKGACDYVILEQYTSCDFSKDNDAVVRYAFVIEDCINVSDLNNTSGFYLFYLFLIIFFLILSLF